VKYRHIASEKDGWSDWIVAVDQELRSACCDCCLVHDFRFKSSMSPPSAVRSTVSKTCYGVPG
jgi:hypothetical protein